MKEKNRNGKIWDSRQVRTLRLKMGLSQAEMSLKLGISIVDLSNWESGKQEPLFENINALQMLDNQAESYSETVQRRPIADLLMHTLNLQQISHESCREMVFNGEGRPHLSPLDQRQLRNHVNGKKSSPEAE